MSEPETWVPSLIHPCALNEHLLHTRTLLSLQLSKALIAIDPKATRKLMGFCLVYVLASRLPGSGSFLKMSGVRLQP
jgi:hypothetical protein